MKSACWFLSVVVFALLGVRAFGAGLDQDRALATLLQAGATIERDERSPGEPIIAVNLSFTGAGDKEMEALRAFPELRRVKLRECIGVTEKGMRSLAGLTKLQELELTKTRVPDEGLKHLEALANLQSLDLTWSTDITDEGLRHIRRLVNLERLNLSDCGTITDKGLSHLRGLTSLRELTLWGTKISNDGLVCLKHMCGLQSLNLGSTEIDDRGLVHLAELVGLRSLELSSTRITDDGLAHLETLTDLQDLRLETPNIEGHGLAHLEGLTSLCSLRLGDVSGEALAHVGKLPRLHTLGLFFARRITDADLQHLRKLDRLRRLELDYMRSLTDEGLQSLQGLADLRALDLGHIDKMTDKGMEHLRGLKKLRYLHLHRLESVTDSGLRHLEGLTDPRRLELRHLTVTDKGLDIIKGFDKLTILSLEDTHAADEVLKHIGRLSNLRLLNLSQTQVSDAGMMYLQTLANLRDLDLSDTSITNRGLGHLKVLQELRTLYVEHSDVTDEGVEGTRRARPEMKVVQFRFGQSVALGGGAWVDKKLQPPLASLVRILADSDDTTVQLDVLRGMYEALQGRRNVTAPEGWSAVYRKLADSKNAEVREKVLQLSVLFGDPQALAVLRKTASDPKADTTARRNALQTLIDKRPPDLLPLLQKLVADRALRGPAVRGLASYDDPGTPALLLEHYASFSDAEKADVIATLAARPKYARALLDAMEKGRLPRRDLSAFTVRQLLTFKDKELTDRLTKVWGSIRPPSAEKAALLVKYKAKVPADALKKADRKHGRALFARTCASCHTLFGEGGKIGPDLTGSQRANPEYLLTKLLDPSAVVAKDYQMTVITTTAGRIISGLVKEESDKTLTMQTQNEVVRVPKSDIEERRRSEQSMMPDGLLAPLSPAEVRDLIAYVSGPDQVPLPPGTPPAPK